MLDKTDPLTLACNTGEADCIAVLSGNTISCEGISLTSDFAINRIAKALQMLDFTGTLLVVDAINGSPHMAVDIQRYGAKRLSEGTYGFRRYSWDEQNLTDIRKAISNRKPVIEISDTNSDGSVDDIDQGTLLPNKSVSLPAVAQEHLPEGVLIQLNDKWRIADDPLQWIFQHRRARPGKKDSGWRNEYFCATKVGLIRCLGMCGEITPESEVFVNALPAFHADWK